MRIYKRPYIQGGFYGPTQKAFARALKVFPWLIVILSLAVLTSTFVFPHQPTKITASLNQRVDDLTACVERFALKMKASESAASDFGSAYQMCYALVSTVLVTEEQQNRNENLSFQMSENIVIMWMVVVITISGVILSGLQLLASYKLAAIGKGELATSGEVRLEKGGLVVQSSVIGVIILAISFAFFMIFVRDIYTIREIQPSAISQQQARRPSTVQPNADRRNTVPNSAPRTVTDQGSSAN